MTGTTGACGRLGEASCGSRSRQRRRCASASEICRTRSARFSSGVPTAWVSPLAAAVVAASVRSVPTRPSRDSSTATIRGWSFSSAAAARVVFGAAGKLTTQPVTAATIATASKAAAVSGTRTASGLPGSANGAIRICGSRPAANRSDAAEFTTSRTVSSTTSASASSSSSTTRRPSAPSTCALATPATARTGLRPPRRARASAGTAAAGPGPGAHVARSATARLPRRRLLPLTGRPVPNTRAVDWLTVSITGAVSVCTASAALASRSAPRLATFGLLHRPHRRPRRSHLEPSSHILHNVCGVDQRRLGKAAALAVRRNGDKADVPRYVDERTCYDSAQPCEEVAPGVRVCRCVRCGSDLRAPADVDPSAGTNTDADRRRRRRRRREIPRQRRVVGRRRDVAVDRVGHVGAPAHRNTPADACAHVGVGHTGGQHEAFDVIAASPLSRGYPRPRSIPDHARALPK